MSDHAIRVDFERSGGPAAFSLSTRVDASELSADEIAELERLVAERGAGAARGVDRFQYDLKITRGDEVSHVVLGESAFATPALRALRDRLVDRARRGK